jgi:lipoprotein NlpI
MKSDLGKRGRGVMAVRKIICILIVWGLLPLISCDRSRIPSEIYLDTPRQHAINGMKLLNAGKIEAPYKEFLRAIELDPAYSPAHVGMGLVNGFRARYVESLQNMILAEHYAKGKEQRFLVNVGFMRVYIIGREKIHQGWLKKVEAHFDKAILLDKNNPEPYFFMGLAYKMSFQFKKATGRFFKVMEIGKDYAEDAHHEFLSIQKVDRSYALDSSGNFKQRK